MVQNTQFTNPNTFLLRMDLSKLNVDTSKAQTREQTLGGTFL